MHEAAMEEPYCVLHGNPCGRHMLQPRAHLKPQGWMGIMGKPLGLRPQILPLKAGKQSLTAARTTVDFDPTEKKTVLRNATVASP